VDVSVINGVVRIEAGVLNGVDVPALVRAHNAAASALVA
jgi:hypothetical protein